MATEPKKSSFTADVVAHRRTFTDIELSREIYEIIKRNMTSAEIARVESAGLEMTPFFEARYLLADEVLDHSGVVQVLELASGLCPRGMIRTRHNPQIHYVEMDLPEKIELKKQIVEDFVSREILSKKSNLRLIGGNALNGDDLAAAVEGLPIQPLAILCEGLLRYLSLEDQRHLIRNLHDILSRFGGVLITPDIETLDRINSDPLEQQRYELSVKRLGFDVRDNLLKTIDDARGFYRELGFTISEHELIEVSDRLVSPKRLGISADEVCRVLSDRPLFVLKPK